MVRIMRDSTSPSDIPTEGTDMVAGYVNGLYAWDQAGWDRFAGIPHVTIDVNGTRPDADVLDVELGDATVETAVRWVSQKLKSGSDRPVIYCSRSTMPQLFTAMFESNLTPGTHFHLWVATLDGTQPTTDAPGLVAIQYAGSNRTGGHYDQSAVYDDAWKAGQPEPAGPPWPGEYFVLQADEVHDDNVRAWQQRMKDRTWTITVDGWYGQQSDDVCHAFQLDSTAHGWPLEADGIVGPETWAATWERPITH